MNALPALDPVSASLPAADLMRHVKDATGDVPNMIRVMANSPALLGGYLALSEALDSGVLPRAMRERIALLVAEENACAYSLSAHTPLARRAGVGEAEIVAARNADSTDPRTRVALRLASKVNRDRGQLGGLDLSMAHAGGLSDTEIAEVIGHVALNVLTNYFTKAARVEIDFFPKVTPSGHAA